MGTFTNKYIHSFGDNLTDKQIEMVKNTLRYGICKLADELEELKRELKITLFKNINKWRINV